VLCCGLLMPTGNPLLLERTSNAINVVKSLFHDFDQSQDGFVDRQEFKVCRFSFMSDFMSQI